ncbi:ferritin-like domain-containing protein [bacterium]|nr:ferritin-like domain-containing protein [bacterium]
MEVREFAERILFSPDLESKLAPPAGVLTDQRPGLPTRVSSPEREDALRFVGSHSGAKMPKTTEFGQVRTRGVAHHIMANHELQALEIMAWTLLAFPDAPTDFRQQLVPIMLDEQRHTRMHLRRAQSHGVPFGSIPVNGHVWLRTQASESLLDYLACLPLTFEGGNLDHSLQFARLFDQAGDAKSRDVMKVIHADEIEHVAFGLRWFRVFKPDHLSDWEAYVAHLRWPLTPYASKGKVFQRTAREQAGMSLEFIESIRQAKAIPRRSRNTLEGKVPDP